MFLKNNRNHNHKSQFPLALSCKRVLLFCLLCLFVLFSHISFAQYQVSGDNRGTIEYRQIKTDKFHIVYPHYYENNAQILARILDTVVPVIGSSLNTQVQRAPILIHTRSSKSNGMSIWAPKRMEFRTTTPPNTYAYPYMWQLALHEYRHTAQMSALDAGITKSLGKIFGEHILGGISEIWIPNWFFEGDAVVAETALAPAGRGQDPEYNMYFKAQILDKGRYSSDKMILGSMKDFVPDQYNTGYFLVSHARNKYGKDIWGKSLNYLGKNWWKLIEFGNMGELHLDYNTIFDETVDSLEKVWVDQDIEYLKNEGDSIIKQWGNKEQFYCNYKNPIQINDSTILALKTSMYKSQSLVKITNDKEEHLLYVPYLLHSYFDYKDGHILYAQYSPSIRWQQESAADIIEYDLNTKKYRRITSEATLFTPIFYPMDSVIGAIMTDDLDNQSLSIIAPNAKYFKNRHFGKKIKSVYLKNISYDYTVAFSYPAWEKESGDVFIIVTDTKGKAIMRYNRDKETFTPVTEFSYDNIRYLKLYGNRLYFVKDINGKYQLLSLDINNTADVQIHTNSRYGIDNYCIYDSTIVSSDYTADGFKIVSRPYISRAWNLNNKAKIMPFTQKNREQENFILTKEVLDNDKIFPSTKYKKHTHLFDFHSWAPLYINIQSIELGLGASVMSQNLLSSSVLEAGFMYNIHDKNKLFAHYTYSGFYPIFEATINYRPRNINRDLDSNIVPYLNWNEINFEQKITLPFTWVNRNMYNKIDLAFYYTLNNITNADHSVRQTTYNSLGYQATFTHHTAMAQNDMFPRWGFIADFKWLNTLTSDDAHIFASTAKVFFPGFARNHSFVLTASTQFNTPEVYYFPNEINFVRGVYDMFPKKFYGLLASYHLPLFYPDSGVPGYLYITRVATRPFYNIGSYDKNIYSSFGTDLEARIHILGMTVPIDTGFRIGYIPEKEDWFASFIFNIDL